MFSYIARRAVGTIPIIILMSLMVFMLLVEFQCIKRS